MVSAAHHFGHRESAGIVVDLFWKRGNSKDEFLVEVEDVREGVRFVLRPTTGREAIQAFYHPFAAATAFNGELDLLTNVHDASRTRAAEMIQFSTARAPRR